jgi:hypothetical protein
MDITDANTAVNPWSHSDFGASAGHAERRGLISKSAPATARSWAGRRIAHGQEQVIDLTHFFDLASFRQKQIDSPLIQQTKSIDDKIRLGGAPGTGPMILQSSRYPVGQGRARERRHGRLNRLSPPRRSSRSRVTGAPFGLDARSTVTHSTRPRRPSMLRSLSCSRRRAPCIKVSASTRWPSRAVGRPQWFRRGFGIRRTVFPHPAAPSTANRVMAGRSGCVSHRRCEPRY